MCAPPDRATVIVEPTADPHSAPQAPDGELTMTRYLVERTFPDGLGLPSDASGAEACKAVVAVNGQEQVTWLHSYVTPDKKKTFCIYDGPSPEAIRKVAERNNLPVDQITEVRVLDPYFNY
jgi:hypothetical protein